MKTWRDYVRRVVPYTPGEQPNRPGMIKLNTNENPYPPAPGVVKMAAHLETDKFRLYPDPTAGVLTKALAEFYHVAQEQIFVGVGSDDVLAMAFQTFFNSEKPIFFPDITYSFYPVWADAFKIPYETKALDENFRIRKEDYYGENGGVVFPNPNAPTSVYEDLDFVEDILKHNRDVLVIVDEAYIDFGGRSALALIEKYDNLLVVQTFSKSRSMAGMRIGYAIGNEELIKALNDFKYSFNSYTMDQTSLVLGAEAVKDREYFNECLEKIMCTRAWTAKELKALGFEFNEPWANFIFAAHPKYPAKELFEALRKANIYVRYFSLPRIDNYLRITVGTDAEMETLIHFLKDYMK
ncbi:pyridoxal phosphate-dependent aminotransferase [Frisingicoccus sp.]|uniref:pyridoxal phosphate-dependent aminotransferase n=1 Tax=Frisingicoccus sp. TaxID=1918627 RepID=UPI003AB33BCD